LAKASSYGFELRGPAQLYIDCCLLLGVDFDTDAQYVHFKPLLDEMKQFKAAPASQLTHADKLYAEISTYYDQVIGENAEYYDLALAKIIELAERTFDFKNDSFNERLYDELVLLYPEKTQFIAEQSIKLFIEQQLALLEQWQVTDLDSKAFYVLLSFFIGQGAAQDGFYPWIAKTLNDDKLPTMTERLLKLRNRSLVWLNAALANNAA
jgi:hypothetical protein